MANTPLGGKLVQRKLKGDKRIALLESAGDYPTISVDMEAWVTLEMIAEGILSPNEGFMTREDYHAVLYEGRLSSGVPWPTPLTFAPSGEKNKEFIGRIREGDEILLITRDKTPVARMEIEEKFSYDREERARQTFGTTDRRHPGVDSIYRRMGDTSIAGPIDLINTPDWGFFGRYKKSPDETRRAFKEMGWKHVVGFITGANPAHRGHEYMHKCVLETHDGLFIQPLVEMAKKEYIRGEYRLLAYDALVRSYYKKEKVLLAPLRVTYIFAGPREAILHAIIERNYGCTHFIVGRDHAGVGDYYDKYACHTVFEDYPDLGIEALQFKEVFFCTLCATTATSDTCPHDERYRIKISGTGIRECLRRGYLPPKEIVRPEVSRIAILGVQPKGVDEDGETIYPSGATIRRLFPFYLVAQRLGGFLREKKLSEDTLTSRDLEAALLDVRTNAHEIYTGVFWEAAAMSDINRDLLPRWIFESRGKAADMQTWLVNALVDKVKSAEEAVEDKFMYQNKIEAERELKSSRKMLSNIPKEVPLKEYKKRVWNPLPYDEYRERG